MSFSKWRDIEEDTLARRRERCATTLAAIIGGEPDEAPRIAVCLSGVSRGRTPLSCVGFLDGLAVPLHPMCTTKGKTGVKLLDAVTTIAASSTPTWICATMLISNVVPDLVHTEIHHPWLYTNLASSCMKNREIGSESARQTTDAVESERAQPHDNPSSFMFQYPWCFGPNYRFDEQIHLYNGLASLFSRRNFCHVSGVEETPPWLAALLSATLGDNLCLPAALLNVKAGGTAVERWAAFLKALFDSFTGSLRNAQANSPSLSDADEPEHKSTVPRSLPMAAESIRSLARSGDYPYLLLTAAAKHPLAYLPPDNAARWMSLEITPFFIRRYSLGDTQQPNARIDEDVQTDAVMVNLDSSKQTEPSPLPLHHALALCTAAIPHLVEQRELFRNPDDLEKSIHSTDSEKEKPAPTSESQLNYNWTLQFNANFSAPLSTTPLYMRQTATPPASPGESNAEDGSAIFAEVRDVENAESAIPLCSLLHSAADPTNDADGSTRQYDIIVVHDTPSPDGAPNSARLLRRAIALGHYVLADDDPDPAEPFADSFCVFHGAAGYPTIIYVMGTTPTRLLEAAASAFEVRQICRQMREEVMEKVSPVLVAEARRSRYLRRTGFSKLSYQQEKTLQPTQLRHVRTFVPPISFRTTRRAEEVIVEYLKLFNRRHNGPPGESNELQRIETFMCFRFLSLLNQQLGVKPSETAAAPSTPQEGKQDGIQGIFTTLSKMTVLGVPQDMKSTVTAKLNAVALHSFSFPERRQLSFDVARSTFILISTIFPVMNTVTWRALGNLLRSCIISLVPCGGPECICNCVLIEQTNVCHYAAEKVGTASPEADPPPHLLPHLANKITQMYHHYAQISTGSASLFATNALLEVYVPNVTHTTLGYLTPLVASIGDFSRIKWLALPPNASILTFLLMGSVAPGITDELLCDMCFCFVDQLHKHLQSSVNEAQTVVPGYYEARQKDRERNGIVVFFTLLSNALESLVMLFGLPGMGPSIVRFLRQFIGMMTSRQLESDGTVLSHIYAPVLLECVAKEAHFCFMTEALLACLKPVVPHIVYVSAVVRGLEASVVNVLHGPRTRVQALLLAHLSTTPPPFSSPPSWGPYDIVLNCIGAALPGDSQRRLPHDSDAARCCYRLALPQTIANWVCWSTDTVKDAIESMTQASEKESTLRFSLLLNARFRQREVMHLFFCRFQSNLELVRYLFLKCKQCQLFLPYLRPLIRHIHMPSYTDHPVLFEELIHEAVRCPHLIHMTFHSNATAVAAYEAMATVPPVSPLFPPIAALKTSVSESSQKRQQQGRLSSFPAARSVAFTTTSTSVHGLKSNREVLPIDCEEALKIVMVKIETNKRGEAELPSPKTDAALSEIVHYLSPEDFKVVIEP